ncbi:metal ABC transporter permease [Clostridium sp.]|uniref:metal ABC transporter permease n=1 Tax=Clostridium sp. TaxID=1506 RepID=UPI00289F21DA|nr:metal ABC transporter permease [Clostridium sp.]
MTINKIFEIFSYPFVTRALIVGLLVSLCAALFGVVLVLKRYSLIGHGLSNVGFASLSLAMSMGLSHLYTSMPVVIVASFIIMAVSQKKGVAGDVAIGIASTASLSAGVIITSITRGFNIDVCNYMFGSILAMNNFDILLSVIVSILVIGLFILFYNRLFLIICDENFAKASGINVTMYQFLISFLTALTVVVGMRIMGTLLISSLIIFPAITAKKMVHSFKALVITSAIISVVCFIIGIIVSFIFNMPTGASIVTVNIVMMIFSEVVSKCIRIGR